MVEIEDSPPIIHKTCPEHMNYDDDGDGIKGKKINTIDIAMMKARIFRVVLLKSHFGFKSRNSKE